MAYLRNLGVTAVFILFFLGIYGQSDDEPVLWSQEFVKISDSEYDLLFKAQIFDGWHLYSQHNPEGGALPCVFTFAKAGTGYKLVGYVKESMTYTEFSDIFEVDEIFFKNTATFTQRIQLLDKSMRQIDVNVSYQVCKEVCIGGDHDLSFALDGGAVAVENQGIDARSEAMTNALKKDLKNTNRLNQGLGQINEGSGIWRIFALGFLGGLIALLTPCVFPMIPLTVSFFTKQTNNNSKGIVNAIVYGLFIVLIYALLSLPFHLFDSVDSQILNTIATNIWLNVVFFVVFVFFAFSFFGYYELTLPSSWANTMDNASTKAGGFIGIFFMAVTLAIVSFSCTGPILGGLLGSTALAEGNVATNLTAGMTGFGLALALPFALFALFPAWLGSLPKSGGWMVTVKVVLGFLELALALKFLSNADLVGHWGLLKREVFLTIWILIFLVLTLYLFGVFRARGAERNKPLALGRKATALLSAAFTVYMVLGLAKITDLKLLSGFPPPQFYSIFEQPSDCPLGLDCHKDFDQGLVHAQRLNKPILLDFTGWACVNCRKMEENVWSDPMVYSLLKERFILISLYVDDREDLPENAKFNFKYPSGRVKSIETIGQKWGTFQTLNFNAASQPYYVLLSPSLEVLNPAIQNTDVETYRQWLQTGLDNFGH